MALEIYKHTTQESHSMKAPYMTFVFRGCPLLSTILVSVVILAERQDSKALLAAGSLNNHFRVCSDDYIRGIV